MLAIGLTYFISYFLSYSGFLLANAAKEEIEELEKKIKITIDIFLFIAYISTLFILKENTFIFYSIIGLIIIKIWGYKQTKVIKNLTNSLHNILLFSITLITTYKFFGVDYMYIVLIPIFILMFENTLKEEFDKKVEGYRFALVFSLFILLNTL